jgi:hypothetical protein
MRNRVGDYGTFCFATIIPLGALAPSGPDKTCQPCRQQRDNDGIKAVKQAPESRVAVSTRTEHHADISESEPPRQTQENNEEK